MSEEYHGEVLPMMQISHHVEADVDNDNDEEDDDDDSDDQMKAVEKTCLSLVARRYFLKHKTLENIFEFILYIGMYALPLISHLAMKASTDNAFPNNFNDVMMYLNLLPLLYGTGVAVYSKQTIPSSVQMERQRTVEGDHNRERILLNRLQCRRLYLLGLVGWSFSLLFYVWDIVILFTNAEAKTKHHSFLKAALALPSVQFIFITMKVQEKEYSRTRLPFKRAFASVVDGAFLLCLLCSKDWISDTEKPNLRVIVLVTALVAEICLPCIALFLASVKKLSKECPSSCANLRVLNYFDRVKLYDSCSLIVNALVLAIRIMLWSYGQTTSILYGKNVVEIFISFSGICKFRVPQPLEVIDARDEAVIQPAPPIPHLAEPQAADYDQADAEASVEQ